MLRSLRGRMLFSFVSLLLVVLVILGFILAGRARREASDALEERLTLEGRALASGLGPLLAQPDPAAGLRSLAKAAQAPGTEVVILGTDGSVLYASGTASVVSIKAPEVREALAGRTGRAVRPNPETGSSELNLAVPILQDGSVVGVVQVVASRRELGEAVEGVVVPIVIVGAVGTGVTLAMVLALTMPLAASLRRVSAVARRLASGYLYERVERPGTPEAEELAEAINQMASGLEQRVRDSFEQRDTLGAVIDTMADALLVTDEHGVVSLVNPAALQLFDAAPAEVIGRSFIEVVRDHEIEEVLHKTLATGHSQSGEVDIGPGLRMLRVVATPIEQRDRPSVLVIVQDLTTIQRLEGMRREFVANLSHELRTPLASIKAAVEALQGGAAEDKALASEFLERVNNEVDELTQLVQRLMDLSRVETGKAALEIKPLDIREVIGEVAERLRPLAEQQGLSVETDYPPRLRKVMADRASVSEVLVNLLGNAIKFTPGGGSIRLSARLSEEMVEIAVEDTGEGIHPDHLPHIFERFYKADRSRSSDGVGLGLAIAKHLIQAQGGRIWAESVLDEGSVFHITLPEVARARRRTLP